jgi:hypothetical protein
MSAVSQAILRAHGNAGMRGTIPSGGASQIHLHLSMFGVIAKPIAARWQIIAPFCLLAKQVNYS